MLELQYGIFAAKTAALLCVLSTLSGMTRGFVDALMASAHPLWRATTKWAALPMLACAAVVLLHGSAPQCNGHRLRSRDDFGVRRMFGEHR